MVGSEDGEATEVFALLSAEAAVTKDRFATGDPGAVRVDDKEVTAHDFPEEVEEEGVGRDDAPGGGHAFPLVDEVVTFEAGAID